MESDGSINLVDSEALNAHRSVVVEEEHENPCEHSEEGENVGPPRFHSYINFFHWSLPSLLYRTKGQLKFPARREELVLERVVEVVVHARQQIRIVTQAVSVTDAEHGLKITKRLAVWYFSVFLFEIYKIFIRKLSTFIYNPQALPGSQKFRTWCFSLTV